MPVTGLAVGGSQSRYVIGLLNYQPGETMIRAIGSFFGRVREKMFRDHVNHEIFERLFPHHRGDKNFGYPFKTFEEMQRLSQRLDVRPLLNQIEAHIKRMPSGYGEDFRYIMHRDLHERFRMYERLAQTRVQRCSCDPKHVASRA